MTGSRVVAFALLLAAGQTQPSPPSASGLIVGQVIDAGSGRPIAGAIVTITGPPPPRLADPRVEPPPPPPRILTGTDGRFLFRDLERGNYTITAQRNGYAEGAYGRRRPNGSSRPVTLAAGEGVGDVTIAMWRFGAITGTVVDEAGEAAVGLSLRALRSTVVAGRRRFAGGGTAITDDRGVYRIGNLVPGDYLVTAPIRNVAVPIEIGMERTSGSNAQVYVGTGLTSESPGAASVIQVRDSTFVLNRGAIPAIANDGRLFVYPTTYYPSATAVNQATTVTVGSGEERTAIDFQLRPLPTATVSGTVTGPEGPRSGAQVRLWPAETDELIYEGEGLLTMTRANGTFVFPAVPIGNYVLRLQVRPPSVAKGATVRIAGGVANPLLWAELPVAVGRNDITNLDVVLRLGFRVSGRVEFEGSGRRPFPTDLQQVPVIVDPAEGASAITSPAALVDMSGQFTTTGNAPGRYLLRIANSPTGWMFKSAMHGGRDISETPFDLTEDVSGVVVTFTNRWTGLQGAVRNRQGAPDADATVVVFPVDPERWVGHGTNPRRVKSARVTGAGTYVVNSLPPGEYFAAALPEEHSSDWQDPKVLEALAQVATRVTVYEGEKATQDLITRGVQ